MAGADPLTTSIGEDRTAEMHIASIGVPGPLIRQRKQCMGQRGEMADESMEAELARFDERLKSIERMLLEMVASQKEASEGRRRGYEAQERTEREIIVINHRLGVVEKSVDAIRPTTAELEKVRDRVIAAGSFGKFLWGVGKALISAAAGAVAVYYSMTGKPPP